MDEIFHAPKIFLLQNDSITELILTALRMENRGPEAPSWSTDHGVSDTLMGDAMIQEITAHLRQLLTRPAIQTQLEDQFRESDHLV